MIIQISMDCDLDINYKLSKNGSRKKRKEAKNRKRDEEIILNIIIL